MSRIHSANDDGPVSVPPVELEYSGSGRWWTSLERRGLVFVVLAEFAGIVLLWQIATGMLELVSPVFLPAPSSIVAGLVELVTSGEIWVHLGVSLACWMLGYLLAIVVGVAFGIALGASVPVHRMANPIVWSFYAIPWLAYRPLSVVWFGFGLAPIIFLVFIASLFPILLNTAAGVGTTEPSLLRAGRIFGASRLSIYKKIVMPSSLPFIFAGMSQSVVMATISLIVAEMTGSSLGVGALISYKTNTYRTDQAFVMIAIAVLWTVAMSQVVRGISRVLVPWRADARLI